MIKKLIIIILILFPVVAFSADYHIGPGQTYTSIANFTGWTSLAAGDHVYIHYATYAEHILLCQSGTEENPIVIEGVPDGSGNLPILDGDNAVIPTQFDGHLPAVAYQGYGIVYIHRSYQDDAFGVEPEWITIKNLEIKSATPELYTFTNSEGTSAQAYPDASAGIYIKTGNNITVENCIIHDCGNGFDIQGVDAPANNITLRGCYIYGNGRTDARLDREHNSYTEAIGMVYEYNYFGPLRSGSGGIAIKDRSIGTVIRYNVIYSGARALDLVDTENIAGSGYDVLNDPNWGNDWVYGNVFINDENASILVAAQPFHYGYDNVAGGTRAGNLRFFNNTVYSNISSGTVYSYRIFDVSTSDEIVTLYNNAFITVGTTTVYMAVSSLEAETGTFNWLGGNWITTGYNQVYGGDTITWNENVSILSGSNTGVLTDPANGDFTVLAGSPLLRAGVSLPSSITDYHPLLYEYLATRSYQSRVNTGDIGAFDYISPILKRLRVGDKTINVAGKLVGITQ